MTQAAPQIPLPVPQPESDFYWGEVQGPRVVAASLHPLRPGLFLSP